MMPNYNIMLDSYICSCQNAYNEYKNVLIQWIKYSGINNDGKFIYYGGNLINKVLEKRKEYNEAMEQLNKFKTLNSKYLEEVE